MFSFLKLLLFWVAAFTLPGILSLRLLGLNRSFSGARWLVATTAFGFAELSLLAVVMMLCRAGPFWLGVAVVMVTLGKAVVLHVRSNCTSAGIDEDICIKNGSLRANIALVVAIVILGYPFLHYHFFWLPDFQAGPQEKASYLCAITNNMLLPDPPPVYPNTLGATNTRLLFSSWTYVQGAMAYWTGCELIVMVWRTLRPVLLLLQLAAIYSLGLELFRRRTWALSAIVFHLLFLLSSLYKTTLRVGEFHTMRLDEDKWFVAYVLFPMALLPVIRFLRSGKKEYIFFSFLMCGAMAASHPTGIANFLVIAFPLVLIERLVSRDTQLGWKPVILLFALCMAWLVLPAGLYFYIKHVVGGLSELNLPFSHVIRFGSEGRWFIAAPYTVKHPLMWLSMLSIVPAAFMLRRHRSARFVFSLNFVLVMYLFNPLVVAALSKVLPYMLILRLLWLFPVALSCAWVFGQIYTWAAMPSRAWTRRLATTAASLLLVGVLALLVRPTFNGMMRMEVFYVNFFSDQVTAVFVENRDRVKQGEAVAMPVSYGCWVVPLWPQARVLTFRHSVGHPEAWALMEEIYGRVDDITREVDRLGQSSGGEFGLAQIQRMMELGISKILVPRGNALRAQIVKYPAVFREEYATPAYLMFSLKDSDGKGVVAASPPEWVARYEHAIAQQNEGDATGALAEIQDAMLAAGESEPLLLRKAAQMAVFCGKQQVAIDYYDQFLHIVGRCSDTPDGRWYRMHFASRIEAYEEVIRIFESTPMVERTYTMRWEYLKSLYGVGHRKTPRGWGWCYYQLSGVREFYDRYRK